MQRAPASVDAVKMTLDLLHSQNLMFHLNIQDLYCYAVFNKHEKLLRLPYFFA